MKSPTLGSILLSAATLTAVATSVMPTSSMADTAATNGLPTKTPIKHLVVILSENVSFNHYFGTYPKAANPEGEPQFIPASNTPTGINNYQSHPELLTNNPNLNPANGTAAANPFRLDRTQATTADQNHNYTPEQTAYDGGKNDLFPKDVGRGSNGGAGAFGTPAQVMGYYDGNTVTAFWNYAQRFAMSDNAWTDTFGPSTPGALNMFAGQTNGLTVFALPAGTTAAELFLDADVGFQNTDGSLTLFGDVDPVGDACFPQGTQIQMTGKNVGDLLNAASIPWGSFVGGFDLQTVNANGSTGCTRTTVSPVTGVTVPDYILHHMWFQYYKSTSNPTHAHQTSTEAIGYTMVPGTATVDPANHAYDLDDFFTAVQSGNYPAVSFIKAPGYQDGHPAYSDPLDEQAALVKVINFLQQQPDWKSTAVIVTHDDSDGWYDHASAPISRGSFSPADTLNGAGNCGTPGKTSEPTGLSGQRVAGRCGPGTRVPFLVISPYAKKNYVSHVQVTQASIPRFIEDNWLKGQRIGGGSFDASTGAIDDMFNFNSADTTPVMLDPTSGTAAAH